jgi:hypothetical protein
MMHLRRYALATALLALIPLSAGAAAIREDFTLVAPYPNFISSGSLFPATSFAKFNPALGTLDDLEVRLRGAARWTITASPDVFSDSLSLAYNPTHLIPGAGQFFYTDSIDINLSGGSTFAPDLSAVTGTGTTNIDLVVYADRGDLFGTTTAAGLVGSITYLYTPAAIPEPTMLGLFCASLAALGFVRRRTRIRPRHSLAARGNGWARQSLLKSRSRPAAARSAGCLQTRSYSAEMSRPV